MIEGNNPVSSQIEALTNEKRLTRQDQFESIEEAKALNEKKVIDSIQYHIPYMSSEP